MWGFFNLHGFRDALAAFCRHNTEWNRFSGGIR